MMYGFFAVAAAWPREPFVGERRLAEEYVLPRPYSSPKKCRARRSSL